MMNLKNEEYKIEALAVGGTELQEEFIKKITDYYPITPEEPYWEFTLNDGRVLTTTEVVYLVLKKVEE
jgi:hypothetical protein